MAGVTLQNLTVRFGEFTAVDALDLRLNDGEFVVFLGPSGCGKTTTLRCVAGLERPSAGEIRFDGERIEHVPAAARDVAMVFQFISLYPHLRVAENIAFPLRARGHPRREIQNKVRWAAKLFRLEDELRRFPGGLPPGTKQKVALARAVVRDPKVLLLDEPLSALDERFREEMRWELGHLQKELGITTIYVTHDQREAMSLADRIVLMRDGRVVQVSTPAQMYSEPVDEFAAYFIGSPSMNFIEAAPDEHGLRLGDEGLILPLSRSALHVMRAHAATSLRLGIRPQHVVLGVPPAPAAPGWTRARVLDRYNIGREHYFDFGIGDRTLLGMKVQGEPTGDPGVAFELAHVHLFDRDTGRRLPVQLDGPSC